VPSHTALDKKSSRRPLNEVFGTHRRRLVVGRALTARPVRNHRLPVTSEATVTGRRLVSKHQVSRISCGFHRKGILQTPTRNRLHIQPDPHEYTRA
jgi:hypothetical protein